MEPDGLGGANHFRLLHSLIDNYKLNGESDVESDSDDFEDESDGSEDICGQALEEHILARKVRHIEQQFSSDDDDIDESEIIFGQPSQKTTSARSHQKRVKEQGDAIREAMDLNSKMRDALLSIEQSLVQALQRIMSEKQALKLNHCSYKLVEEKSDPDLFSMNRGFYKQFGMPYFKDKDDFPCPQNDDTKMKIRCKELIATTLVHNNWRVDEIRALELGIKSCLIDEYKDIYEKKTGKKANDSGEVEAYNKYVKSNNLATLLQSDPDRNFDWMKISVSKFGECHSSTECRNLWNLYLKPTRNKQKWTTQEMQDLRMIAAKYSYQNWDQIAHELNTSRSGYQCFIHYKTKVPIFLNAGPWTKEEDMRLVNLLKMCRYGPYVAWSKVCFYMESRTFQQIYARWNNCLDPNLKKGRFNKKEDSLILESFFKLGKEPKDIAKLLGNRNSIQIRDRLENSLKPLLENNVGEWTLEEDRKLLELAEELGDQKSKWSEIAKRFKTRSRTQIRHRYNNLRKKMIGNPNFQLEKLNRRKNRSNARVQMGKRQKMLNKLAMSLSDAGVKKPRCKKKVKVKLSKKLASVFKTIESSEKILKIKHVSKKYERRKKKEKVPPKSKEKSFPKSTKEDLAPVVHVLISVATEDVPPPIGHVDQQNQDCPDV